MSSGLSARLRAISSSSSRSSGCAHWRSSIHTTTGPRTDAQADRRDQRVVQRVAGAGGVERVELRRVSEQMEQRLDLVAHGERIGRQVVLAGRRGGHDLAHLGSRLVELQADAGRQPVGDRPPHVRLAVRRALALDDADSGVPFAGARRPPRRRAATCRCPASPTTDTIAQCPVATSSVTDCSSVRSVTRPTNAISERRRRFAAGAIVPSASHACSICSRPLSSAASCGSKRIASEHSTRVASPTSTPPSGANSCSRDAMLTTSPIAV